VDNTKQQEMTHLEQTREKLLTSGLNLLLKKGYRGATSREIALGAGVAEITMYRHFRSKDELFVAAVTQRGEAMLSFIPEPSGDVEADLLQASTSLLAEISMLPVQLIGIVPELKEHDDLKEPIDRVTTQMREKFISFISYYQTKGLLAKGSDIMIFMAFIGPIFLFVSEIDNTNEPFDHQQHVQLFLNGLYVGKK